MKVSSNLKKVAKEFSKQNHPLYIVGGFVRDNLLGVTPSDIDIASTMPIDDVVALATKLGFGCKIVNKHLGTLLISTKKENWEYTRFRQESYIDGHSPNKVEFVDDIAIDALRRDLTINALYYDIQNDQIIDIIDGQKDIKNGIIRTANSPLITLRDDGLRILRTIRFASTFNFKIDKKTNIALKNFRENLINISKERILNEIKLCVVADLKFGIKNTIFWDNINRLNLLPLLFNRQLIKLPKIDKKTIANFYAQPQDLRLLDFYFAVLKNYLQDHNKHNQLSFAINSIFGLDGIKESSATIRLLEKLYLIYQNIEYNVDSLNASINFLGLTEPNKNLIRSHLSAKSIEILDNNIQLVQGKNLPTDISQLKISAKDIIAKGIEPRYVSSILSTLYNQVLQLKVQNIREDLLNLAIDIHHTFSNLTKGKEKK